MRGGQWQALRLHEALQRGGHESVLLAREGSPLSGYGEPLRPLRLAQLSRTFDILHAHDARSHSLCALFSRVPFVVSRRVAFPVKTSAASRWKYRRAALFLAVSKFVAGQLRAAGVEDNRIAVVYDGVQVPAAPANGNEILTPHTLDASKGMGLAVQAAQVAGIEVRATNNLVQDLPKARALVYLSESEGLGSGILLGMAHGVTVIASRVGGIPELMEDGVTGLLVPNDATAVAAAFARIDPQIGQAARQRVITHFTQERMAEATLEAYSRVLGHA